MFYLNSEIIFKTSTVNSSLCDYNDAYILVNGTLTMTGARKDNGAKQTSNRNKGAMFKNCAPFANDMSKINNTPTDHSKDLNVVRSMYSLIKYSDNYSKTSGSLWQYYRDEPAPAIINSNSFKSK